MISRSNKRPGRPRRMTTEQVVSAALNIVDTEGLDALSMPRLAKQLGVGTMTLYGYVDNKQDLQDRVAAAIFVDLVVPEQQDWDRSLVEFFTEFRSLALAHPALARLLAGGRITIPRIVDILESFLAKAAKAGPATTEAVRTFYAALTYTLGFVMWEIPRTQTPAAVPYEDEWAGLISALEPDRYPRLTAETTRKVAPTVASTEQFQWGLERLLSS